MTQLHQSGEMSQKCIDARPKILIQTRKLRVISGAAGPSDRGDGAWH